MAKTNIKRIAPLTLSLGLLLSACASSYQPVVDFNGVDRYQYEADLSECRVIADQIDSTEEAGTSTLIGTGIGAAMGAALGAIAGDPGTGAAMGATAGGLGGGVKGAGQAENRKKTIINNCLTNRGYAVLG